MEIPIRLDVHVAITLGPTESRRIVGTDTLVKPEEPPSAGYGDRFAVSEIDVGAGLVLDPAVVAILVVLQARRGRC